jgi:uncharacterized protein with von Willebrand factor type A (vWA) domain
MKGAWAAVGLVGFATLCGEPDDGTAASGRAATLKVAASDVEVLRRKDIATLSPAEKRHLDELPAASKPVAPRRRALRTAPARQARRLRRLAHKIVWINPHAGHDGYEPVQSGIVAALPHLDRLLTGHSVDTLHALLEVRLA